MTAERTDHTRRQFVLALSGVAAVGLAGCLGDEDDTDETENRAEISSGQEALIEDWIADVDDELNVEGWRMFGEQFIPEYASGNPPEVDIPLLGKSYARIVDGGFQYETMPTAVDDDGLIRYMVIIEPEWAIEYTAGEIDEAAYVNRIEGTIH